MAFKTTNWQKDRVIANI